MTMINLKELYPVFAENKPLKIGIDKDILQAHENISAEELGKIMFFHVNSLRYVKNIINGTQRFDLQGAPVAILTKKDKEHAKKKRERIEQSINRRKPIGCLLIRVKEIGREGKSYYAFRYRVFNKIDNIELGRYPTKKDVLKAFPPKEVHFIPNDWSRIRHEKFMEKQAKLKQARKQHAGK